MVDRSDFRLWASDSSSMLEVLPALRTEFRSDAVRVDEENLLPRCDLANPGYSDPGDRGRDVRAFRRGEEQFVVIASMQRESKIDLQSRLADPRARERIHLEFRANATFFADVSEIGGKAVAEIDHGRGESFFPQETPNFDAG